MPNFFISSTSEVSEHRVALANWINKKGDGWRAIHQDGGFARPETPIETSLKWVREADIALFIVGRLYGSIPEGHSQSFCELEYDEAVRTGKDIIALFMDESSQLQSPEMLSIIADDPGQWHRQVRFRARIATDLNVGDEHFRNVDHFKALAIQAIDFHLASQASDGGANTGRTTGQPKLFVPKAPALCAPHAYSLQSGRFVGRDCDLLDITTWANASDEAVMALVALGGAGKSALAWQWINAAASTLETAFEGIFWWSFYDDNSFERCVAYLLTYMTGADPDEIQNRSFELNLSEVLSHLNGRRFLVCLDGIERILRGYREFDLSQNAQDVDQDPDKTGRSDFDATFIGESTSEMARWEYRLGVGKAGMFLTHLPSLRSARVLATTRLIPRDFETDQGSRRSGVHIKQDLPYSDQDALALFKELSVTGNANTLLSIANTVANHPLTLRILSGEVVNHAIANGDLDLWLQQHPNFDPYKLEIRQRRRHVLLFALRGLRSRSLAALGAIAAFRGPAPLHNLKEILISQEGYLSNQTELREALEDLRDRHLIGWDASLGAYDMHPIVRGVSWQGFDTASRARLATLHGAHFSTIAQDASASSSQRFYSLEQRFSSLVERRRYNEAFALTDKTLMEEALRAGKVRECISMLEACIDGNTLETLRVDGIETQVEFLDTLGFFYSHVGRNFESFDTDVQWLKLKKENWGALSEPGLTSVDVRNLSGQLFRLGYTEHAKRLASTRTAQWETSDTFMDLFGAFMVYDGKEVEGLEKLVKYASNATHDEPPSWSISRVRACTIIIDACLHADLPEYDIRYARKVAAMAIRLARSQSLWVERLLAETLMDQINIYMGLETDLCVARMEKRLERARQANILKAELQIVQRLIDVCTRLSDLERGETHVRDCLALLDLIDSRRWKAGLCLTIARFFKASGQPIKAAECAAKSSAYASQPDGKPAFLSIWRAAATLYEATNDGSVTFPAKVATPERDINTFMALVYEMTGNYGSKIRD